jgi:hypothetical protein
MDYRHHHLVSHHRHRVIEAASQRPGGPRHDESEEGHDVRNPYMTGLDLFVGEELSRSFEPCLIKQYEGILEQLCALLAMPGSCCGW